MSDKASSGGPANGGAILVSALRAQGVDRVFCVPGESYLTVLDALYDASEISVVSARHEGAAANMAEADGKLTGRPGICFVTRGPGATHASVGVHTAFQDSTPMILFIGQVARGARDREGFQEVDFRAMFGPLAKWVAEIETPSRIPEYVARAFHTAMSGRAGPVVLSLPEDMLSRDVTKETPTPTVSASRPTPSQSNLEQFKTLVEKAARPLVIVGGSNWTDRGCSSLGEFAERRAIPVISSFRRQDIMDNRNSSYCGHLGLGIDPSLAERAREADLLIALGSRLGENTTGGYSLLAIPKPRQTLIHIHPDPDELGRVYQPDLGIVSHPSEFAESLKDLEIQENKKRVDWVNDARAAYVKFSSPAPTSNTYVDLASVVSWLSDNLPDEAIVANGAGNYTVWVHRYFRYRRPRSELAPTSGAMGYGVPAAIAAKLRFPKRDVIAFAGDGCFLMYPQELATAVQHRANLVILIVNNGIYGTIRMHQEQRFPGRVVATDLVNPDFVALAKSFGAFGERVETTAAFPDAFRRATAAGKPAILDLHVDPAQLTPTLRLAGA